MPNALNLQNGGERFNICLETNGDLSFKANAENCAGTPRVTINDDTGNVGIGATNPAQRLHVQGNRVRLENGGRILDLRADGSEIDIETETNSLFIKASGTGNHVVFNPFAGNGNVGIGLANPAVPLQVRGRLGLESDTATGTELWNLNVDNNGNLTVNSNSVTGGITRLFINDDTGNVGIATASPQAKLHVNGDMIVTGDITLPNADCAEEFAVKPLEMIEPGTVMVLGEEGSLCQSTEAYDKKVAGVVSGAGDLKPGLILDKQSESTNRMPIALMGKVYCKVDAEYGPVEVGDLLTTSSTPGHAMKATDPLQAFGTIIGKALRPLEAGKGLIPILVALQ
jgi:hypothetical protein